MFTETDLKALLEAISLDTKYITFEFESEEQFSIELKCKVEKDKTHEFYNEYTKEWIKKFSAFTATTWIVRSSFPKVRRYPYRKIFVCHRSAFNKRREYEKSRSLECRAKIDFKVKYINRNTIKNDPLLKEGLNMKILINFVHTHLVCAPESYSLLRSTYDTDNVFYKYFDEGYPLLQAKIYHELTLIDQYGNNSSEFMSNATINPNIRHIRFIYGKYKKKCETTAVPDPADIFTAKREKLINSDGINITDPKFEIIITPTMKRTLIDFDLDYVLIDSTYDVSGIVTTILYVPSKIGALPVACILQTAQQDDCKKILLTNYGDAIVAFRKVIDNEFKKVLMPKIIMTNNWVEENEILTSIFKYSKIKRSRFSFCIGIWRWLCLGDPKNVRIEQRKRHALMLAMQSMIYSDNLETAEKIYSEMCTDPILSIQKNKTYVEDIWQKRKEWFLEDKECGLNNNLVEATVRFTKDFILNKCQSFDIGIMFDVITNIVENHQRRILLSYAKSHEKTTYMKFLPKGKIDLGFGSAVQRVSLKEFRIEGVTLKPRKFYSFRIDTLFCDCPVGVTGNLCEHLCASLNTFQTELLKIPKLSEEELIRFINLAGGNIEDTYEHIKPEITEEDVEMYDDFDGNKYDVEKPETEEENDMVQRVIEDIKKRRVSVSSLKSEDGDGYIFVEIKDESAKSDPLDSEVGNNDHGIGRETEGSVQNDTLDVWSTSKETDLKTQYENALKDLNNEFRRLNHFFRENPNGSNLLTMKRLTKELSKIRPIERVNLTNIQLKPNSRKTRKRNHSDDLLQ